MKKALSFAVALGLVTGVASVASAMSHEGVVFSGTSRVEGRMVDMSQGSSEDKLQNYRMRTRLIMKANVADNVSVNTRHTLLYSTLGDGAASTGDATEEVDMAYIQMNDVMGASWQLGRIPADWTKFTGYGVFADRIKAWTKVGAGTLGGFIQKSTETQLGSTTGTSGGDNDSYAAYYVGSAGDTKFKAIGIYTVNHTAQEFNTTDCLTGIKAMIDVNGKAGNIGWGGELVLTSGTQYEQGSTTTANPEDAEMALRGGVTVAINDQLTVMGELAYATNDYTADDDYNPSNLIGNSATAITVFGGDNGGDDTSYLLVAGANMKLDDASSVGGGVGYYLLTENGLTTSPTVDDVTMIEVDATYTRTLAKNTTLTVQAAYGMPDNISAADDEIIALGWRLQTKF